MGAGELGLGVALGAVTAELSPIAGGRLPLGLGVLAGGGGEGGLGGEAEGGGAAPSTNSSCPQQGSSKRTQTQTDSRSYVSCEIHVATKEGCREGGGGQQDGAICQVCKFWGEIAKGISAIAGLLPALWLLLLKLSGT